MSKLYDDLVAATCVPEPGRPFFWVMQVLTTHAAPRDAGFESPAPIGWGQSPSTSCVATSSARSSIW
jgi:hypothetical protein